MKKCNCILLVDDDESVNLLNQLILQKLDAAHLIVPVKNGQEALDYLLGQDEWANQEVVVPDIIFLDINMPVMDGFEFLEAYHQLDLSFQNSTIIAMVTSSLDAIDQTKVKAFKGVKHFLSKPLDASKISDILNG